MTEISASAKDRLKEYRESARDIILAVWTKIDWDNVSPSRRMKIYDELSSKIRSAALTSDLHKFLSRLCDKMGVRSISDPRVLKIFECINHAEMLKILREETSFVILMLRETQEAKKLKPEGVL